MYKINEDFSQNTRLWFFLSETPFSPQQMQWMQSEAGRFTQEWAAHGQALKAGFDMVDQKALVLLADEAHQLATGCSIDKAMHFIQKLEQNLGLSLTNRFLLPFWDQEQLVVCRPEHIQNPNLPVWNIFVPYAAEYRKKPTVPLLETWAARYSQQNLAH